MLKLRLSRVGKTKKPYYRLVVSDGTKDMYGDYLELLGNINPHQKIAALKVERIKYWLSVGAQASATVHNLLIKEGVITDQKKAKSVTISKKRQAKIEKNKPQPKEEAKVEVQAETSEAPVEQA